jgi:hypothetical protein
MVHCCLLSQLTVGTEDIHNLVDVHLLHMLHTGSGTGVLGHGARIGELSLYIQASLIADADRVRVNHCRETLSDVLDTDLKEGTE